VKVELKQTEDGSSTLYVPELDETYHSTHGAIQESRHVFIEAGLKKLLLEAGSSKKSIKVFEVGFGTGLNALLSLIEVNGGDISLEYQSIELYPLQDIVIGQLNYSSALEDNKSYFQHIHESPWEIKVDITDQFKLYKINQSFIEFDTADKFDLIYFDAFGPSKQSELWAKDILKKCYQMLHPAGVLVTYSAKGQLKRDLKDLGFKVEALPGPPGKAQMTRAIKL
jgi:tRNA U34 5-methylaminomethyl-2-thiouridine-forming methyltransferase MnmC